VDPTRAPGRRYRRRRHGEPVNPEWTAPPGAAGSLADTPPLGEPLAGVIGETWQEYRRHAVRLLPLAAASMGIAALATELVRLATARFDPLVALPLKLPAVWLLVQLADFLLQAVAVSIIHKRRSFGGPPPARLRECLGEVTGAWLVSSSAILGGLLLGLIPGICLMVMWVVCVPVIVVERTGPLAALGRSRELVRGHGWTVFGCFVLLFLMQTIASVVLRAIFSWLPPSWQLLPANGVIEFMFIPATAVLSTLIYYRLTAARAAAGLS
jgi:hypothetical protein